MYNMKFRIDVASFSDVGPRERNEDAILLDNLNKIFILADGLGGQKDGAFASNEAARIAYRFIIANAHTIAPPELIFRAAQAANDFLNQYNTGRLREQRAASTLTSLYILDDVCYFSHVGDCRLYLISDRLEQATVDHTMAADLIRRGATQSALTPSTYHTLTQAVGTGRDISPQIGSIPLSTDGRLVLCSDGCHSKTDKATMYALSKANATAKIFADELRTHVSRRTPTDNFSAVIIDILDQSSMASTPPGAAGVATTQVSTSIREHTEQPDYVPKIHRVTSGLGPRE
jgi:serine/threonine protein phosphatase PrpC